MRVRSECDFPNFRHRFWSPAVWAGVDEEGQPVLLKPGEGMETVVTRPAARQHRQGLKALDLRSLPREEGPPSELQIRREKFAYFEKRCSEVSDGLYLGSEAVAKSRELLERSNITHVVNCVGFVYPNYFEGELTYKTLFLQDTPAEDITSVLYDVFDFIEEARGGGGSVFVHCSQGVSRSATIVIAFLMWKLDQSFDEVFAAVKAIRGVANPNIGFTCQLLQWHKRRHADSFCRIYCIGPHSSADPLYLVPKLLSCAKPCALDPRGAFVVHTPERLFVWQGRRCPPGMVAAAERAAHQLHRYEGAPWPPQALLEGDEGRSFWKSLQDAESDSHGICEVESYSKDFDMYLNAAASSSDPVHRAALLAGPSPRAVLAHTSAAREAEKMGPGSPNERQRKYRRSDTDSKDLDGEVRRLRRGSNRHLHWRPSAASASSSPLQPMEPHIDAPPLVQPP
uniref:Protein-tyrosine-phosphatase mkp1-like n=1 Tax=Tetraselmis sp. GSL018 TaxID=582737 RepID=A0A061SBV6_9CHLO